MDVTTTRAKTALADHLAGRARMGEYAGCETAADFGDTAAEFEAITENCGTYDLGWRGKIEVTGADRTRWLNGMVTNNINDLKENHGNFDFLLNAQGRIQGDMYVYRRGERLLIDSERSQVEHLMKTLEHFIIMDDVELHDVSEQITSIGVQGPQAAQVLLAAGIKSDCAEPLVVCDVAWEGGTLAVTRMASDDYLTYEIWLAPALAPALWDRLQAAGGRPTGTDALERFRVLAGVPRYGVDIRERDLPQETNQLHALNFTKGCYIGQEIVERIRSRGNVHRTFSGFILDRAAARGTKITDAGGKEVGEITTCEPVRVGGSDRLLALGYIRREAAQGGTLQAGEATVQVSALPFKF